MKSKLSLSLAAFLPVTLGALAQGTLIYDQQSSTNETPPGFANSIQPNQPMGQSFVPSLSAVGFIRLYFEYGIFNGSAASVSRNHLLANSITGAVLASTSPLLLPSNFFGYTNCFFSSQVPVTPGTTYYFQPVITSGDTWYTSVLLGPNYNNGTAFFNGAASANQDLWFREGVVVPEPSSLSLLIGGGVLFYVRRKKNSTRSVR